MKKPRIKTKENIDFDGSWDAHNCYVEKCEWCDEKPENCRCCDNDE